MRSEEFIRIENGQITRKLKLPNGQYRAVFYSKNTRSLQANNYLWMCYELMLEGFHEIGYIELKSKEEVNELMKHMFLRKPIVNYKTGEVIGEITRSTAELSKEEMGNYIDQINMFCIEYLGFPLPEPDSQLKMT